MELIRHLKIIPIFLSDEQMDGFGSYFVEQFKTSVEIVEAIINILHFIILIFRMITPKVIVILNVPAKK